MLNKNINNTFNMKHNYNLFRGKITCKKVLIFLMILLLYNIISNAPESINSFKKGMNYCLNLGNTDYKPME